MDREQYGFPQDTVVTDEDGHTLGLGLVGEVLLPPFGQKYLRGVKDITIRDDDVILCGYPKTGS